MVWLSVSLVLLESLSHNISLRKWLQLLTESCCPAMFLQAPLNQFKKTILDHLGPALSSTWFSVWRSVRLRTTQEFSTRGSYTVHYDSRDLESLRSIEPHSNSASSSFVVLCYLVLSYKNCDQRCFNFFTAQNSYY